MRAELASFDNSLEFDVQPAMVQSNKATHRITAEATKTMSLRRTTRLRCGLNPICPVSPVQRADTPLQQQVSSVNADARSAVDKPCVPWLVVGRRRLYDRW